MFIFLGLVTESEEKVRNSKLKKIRKSYTFSEETIRQMQAIKEYLEERDNIRYYNTTVLEYLVASKYKEITKN